LPLSKYCSWWRWRRLIHKVSAFSNEHQQLQGFKQADQLDKQHTMNAHEKSNPPIGAEDKAEE
jgi:hypothetical protein